MHSKPSATWVLVADGARARILARRGRRHTLRAVFDHDFTGPSRVPTRELVSDRAGRESNPARGGVHGMEPATDPHRYEKTRFARRIAHVLDEAASNHAFDRLILIAPPQCMGDLRSALGKETQRLVCGALCKDLTQLSVHELATHLEPVLAVDRAMLG
ncbi:MAG: host attachment protein [Myxococcota bacterium]